MTRSLVLVVVALCLVGVPAFAQSSINIGAQGGVNFGNADITPDLSTTTRTGFMVGAVVEFEITEMFSIQPEVLYVQKGAKFEMNVSSMDVKATFKFDYIEIPVLFKATFGSSGFRPFVFAGPNVGFNMVSELEGEIMGQTATQDMSEDTESIDFALDFGGGGEFALNESTTLFGSVRYSLGLTDIIKAEDATAKSNGIQVMVGIKWGL
jgi:opacity protein-like surface antigen